MTGLGPPARKLGSKLASHIAVFIVVMVIWQTVVTNGWISPRLVATPTSIWDALVDIFGSGSIWTHFWATMIEASLGLLIGIAVAFALASVSSLSARFRKLATPYVVLFQCTPRVVIAPMLFIWLGFGYAPKIVLVAAIVFFPVFVNTLAGLGSVATSELELFRSLRASRSQIFFRLQLPVAAPLIFAGIKTAASFALVGAVVGEFISAETGLGLLSQRYSFLIQTPYAYAMFVVLAFAGLLFFMTAELLERWVVYWSFDSRLHARAARRAQRLSKLEDPGSGGAPADGSRSNQAEPTAISKIWH